MNKEESIQDILRKKESAKLFKDFNHYRNQTASVVRMRQNHPVNGYKPTTARLALFEDMAKWCRERQIDPRLWLYGLFRGRKWMFPPKLTRGCLLSINMIPKYDKLGEDDYLDAYRKHIDDGEDLEKDEDRWDPNRDINHTVENLKKRFSAQNKEDVCMNESFARTLGYHPKSEICQNCPLGPPCHRQLINYVTFDIMALRQGEITSTEARLQVLENDVG